MIGKTRQKSAKRPAQKSAKIEERFDAEVGRARGVLRRQMSGGTMHHSRRKPARELAGLIAHYWIIDWDLRGCEPHVAESVPHPNVHLVFQREGSIVCGVQTHKFSVVLEGKSRVFGVKFRPGGFRPFFNAPVSTLARRIVPANRIFNDALKPLERIVLSDCSEKQKVEAANKLFLDRMPPQDDDALLAGRIADLILNDPEIKTVDDLARATALGKRSLQRLFSEYVGASPKWVIRRYRLHELVEKLNSGAKLELARLAADLGYFDQAHLINDFRAMTGFSPSQYRKIIANKIS